MSKSNQCPNCECSTFGKLAIYTESYFFDEKGEFNWISSEYVEDSDNVKMICLECNSEINVKLSKEKNKIVLMKEIVYIVMIDEEALDCCEKGEIAIVSICTNKKLALSIRNKLLKMGYTNDDIDSFPIIIDKVYYSELEKFNKGLIKNETGSKISK